MKLKFLYTAINWSCDNTTEENQYLELLLLSKTLHIDQIGTLVPPSHLMRCRHIQCRARSGGMIFLVDIIGALYLPLYNFLGSHIVATRKEQLKGLQRNNVWLETADT